MEGEKKDVEKLLEEGRTIQIFPKGYSMYPLLVPGRDEAVIRSAAGRRLRRGDVVLYRRQSGRLVLHRIWKCKRDCFCMVGDNQTKIEEGVEPFQVKGILVCFVRKGKYIQSSHPIYILVSRSWLLLRPIRSFIMPLVAWLKCRNTNV